MKLTTMQIRKLIKEELHNVISEVSYEENPLAGGASTETIQKAIGGAKSALIKYKTNFDDDQLEAKQIKAIADALQKGASNALKGEENRDAQIYASALAQSLTKLADENDKEKLARARQQILQIREKSGLIKPDNNPKPEGTFVQDITSNLMKAKQAPKDLNAISKLFDQYPLVGGWYALANEKARKKLGVEEKRAAAFVLLRYENDPEWSKELKEIAKRGDLAALEKFFQNKGDGREYIKKYTKR